MTDEKTSEEITDENCKSKVYNPIGTRDKSKETKEIDVENGSPRIGLGTDIHIRGLDMEIEN